MTVATKTKAARKKSARPKPPASFLLHSWTVEQYHEMIDKDILTPDDKVELLDGWIVEKMPQKPSHAGGIQNLQEMITKALPDDWRCRTQLPITLASSEPEPDLAVAQGARELFLDRHPLADEIGLVIEVTRGSVKKDRVEKARIYAEAKIPEYWIVYVSKGLIEVLSKPTNGNERRYRQVKEYRKSDSLPLTLHGKKITEISLRNILK